MTRARKHVSLQEFKAAAKAGPLPEDSDLVLHKGMVDDVKAEGSETDRTLQFTISTASVDRDDDTIAVEGWELANFLKNPVVLWAHDSMSPPLAKAVATWVEGGKLKSRAQFHQEFEFADMVYRLYKGGYMKATSVGFIPRSYVINEDRAGNGWGPAFDFKSQELLEFSAVPVPANPEALHEAGAKGVNLAPMVEWAERILDGEAKGAPVSRDEVEAIRRTLLPKWGKMPAPASPAVDMDALSKRVVDDILARGLVAAKSEPAVEPVAEAASPVAPAEPATAEDDVLEIDDEEWLLEDVERAVEAVVKSGRVLSASNEDRLKRSRDLLDEVLAQVAQTGADPAEPEERSAGDDEIEFDDDVLETLPSMVLAAVTAEFGRQRGALD